MCAPTPAHKDLKGPVDKETESRRFSTPLRQRASDVTSA